MTKKKRTYREFQELLFENIQDPEEAAAYLQAALADEDERVFLLALHDVLEAHGGSFMNKKVKLTSDIFFESLSEDEREKFILEPVGNESEVFIISEDKKLQKAYEELIKKYDAVLKRLAKS